MDPAVHKTPEMLSSAQMRTSIMSVSGNSGLWNKLLTLPLLSGSFPWLEFSAMRRRESWSSAQIQQQIVPCKYKTIFLGSDGAHLNCMSYILKARFDQEAENV